MSKLGSIFEVGRQSLSNSQTGLQTIGHNISNKNTKGFSRQRVELQSNTPVGIGNVRIGTGARTAAVRRINNPHIEKQLEKAQTRLGFAKGRSESLERVEQIYNEQVNKGLNKYLSQFFNSMREFANNPESLATRTLVKETSHSLVKDFQRVHTQLKGVQKDADQQLLVHVENINQMIKEMADLNERIQGVEMAGTQANDERDRRDQLLKDLSSLINFSYSEGESGSITVSTAGTVLVAGHTALQLQGIPNPQERGKLDIYYYSSPGSSPKKITELIKGGEVGGILEVRDKVVEDFLSRVDEMAYSFASEVNKAHQKGYDRYGAKGQSFFDVSQGPKDAAKYIEINDTIKNDVGRIAGASRPNAPADNTIANIISSLQYKGVMSNGRATFDDFYNSMVSHVGIIGQRSMKEHESQDHIMRQLSKVRESVSGVSLDEETTKLVEFQKMFDASAKLIKTADEMMETVLNLKR